MDDHDVTWVCATSVHDDNHNVTWSVTTSLDDDSLSYGNEDVTNITQIKTHTWATQLLSSNSDDQSEMTNLAEKSVGY